MRNAKAVGLCVSVALLVLAVTSGCTRRSGGADDVAEQAGKALDPAPKYVDKPAEEPPKPQ
jgi:hypothetical protein